MTQKQMSIAFDLLGSERFAVEQIQLNATLFDGVSIKKALYYFRQFETKCKDFKNIIILR